MYKLHYSGLHLSSFRMGMLRLDATWQSYKIHNLLHTSLHLSSFSTDVPRHVALHCIALHCIAFAMKKSIMQSTVSKNIAC